MSIPLIPVCNRPIVYYQLDLVVKSSFESVVLVVKDKQEKEVKDKVDKYIRDNTLEKFEVHYIVVEETRDGGDVEILRELGRRQLIEKDFFFIGCDVIVGNILFDLADAHRKYDASVALAYSGPCTSSEASTKKIGSRKANSNSAPKKKSKKSMEYVGLIKKTISGAKDNVSCARVVYSKSKSNFKESEKLVLPKALLAQCPHLSMRSDLHNLNVYLFKRWILDLARKKEELRSIKDDLIPFIVNRDGRTLNDIPKQPKMIRQISGDSTLFEEEEKTWEETERFKVFSVVFPQDMNIFCERTF